MSNLTRRDTLKIMGAAVAAIPVGRAWSRNAAALEPISIGIVADVHQDIIHDGYDRIVYFIDQMKTQKPDMLIQLGDFALPHAWNQPFIYAWNKFTGPRHHVLGNHDMDHGYSKDQTMKWWGMKGKYYSFDAKGWHFVVLDGNDVNPKPWSGYHRYIAEAQQAWLAKDLAASAAPTVIYSHQSLEAPGGVANAAAIRAILEKANQQAGWTRVFACLSGHHHTDYMKTIAGIHYIQINSMSYKWVGGKHRRTRFRPHVEKAHPWVSYTVPYRDPLFTVMTLDPEAGAMKLAGMETEFIPPTPKEMELDRAPTMLPTITARDLKMNWRG